jgi:hypothetical protein
MKVRDIYLYFEDGTLVVAGDFKIFLLKTAYILNCKSLIIPILLKFRSSLTCMKFPSFCSSPFLSYFVSHFAKRKTSYFWRGVEHLITNQKSTIFSYKYAENVINYERNVSNTTEILVKWE